MSSPCPVFVPVPSPVPAHPASWRWAGAQRSAGVAHPQPLSASALGGTGRAESRWAAPARWHLGHPTVRTRGHTSGFGRGRETPGSASAPLTWVSRGLGSGHSWGPAGVQPDPGSPGQSGHPVERQERAQHPPSPAASLFPSDISGSDTSTSRPVPAGTGTRGAGDRARQTPPALPGALRLEPWSGSNRR